jgi:hypothetical protein
MKYGLDIMPFVHSLELYFLLPSVINTSIIDCRIPDIEEC